MPVRDAAVVTPVPGMIQACAPIVVTGATFTEFAGRCCCITSVPCATPGFDTPDCVNVTFPYKLPFPFFEMSSSTSMSQLKVHPTGSGRPPLIAPQFSPNAFTCHPKLDATPAD